MRGAPDIRRLLLQLRDRNRLPYRVMSERSRCTEAQIISALRLEATEDVLRRLDAFLDAPKLHAATNDNRRLYQYEQYNRELWDEYDARTLHPLTFAAKSVDGQRRLLNAIDQRLKNLLAEKIFKESGIRLKFSDGLTYWQAKRKARERGASVGAQDAKPYRVSRARSVVSPR